MLLIICPHCGPRNSDEFTYIGEPSSRPDVGDTSPEDWRRYLYMRSNRNDWVRERWFHVSGCRRFLKLERQTASNEIRDVELVGGEQA
jgi:heterotetrameric sarcosine oxidase delta subunit